MALTVSRRPTYLIHRLGYIPTMAVARPSIPMGTAYFLTPTHLFLLIPTVKLVISLR